MLGSAAPAKGKGGKGCRQARHDWEWRRGHGAWLTAELIGCHLQHSMAARLLGSRHCRQQGEWQVATWQLPQLHGSKIHRVATLLLECPADLDAGQKCHLPSAAGGAHLSWRGWGTGRQAALGLAPPGWLSSAREAGREAAGLEARLASSTWAPSHSAAVLRGAACMAPG